MRCHVACRYPGQTPLTVLQVNFVLHTSRMLITVKRAELRAKQQAKKKQQ